MKEIERKFLVTASSYKNEVHQSYRIVQGFLNTDPERTVRIRIKGNHGFITIKGISNASGTTRFEWEKEITVEEAENLLALCETGRIEKIRHEVVVNQHTFEIDEFFGANQSLILAEIELSDENEYFDKPNWLGKEVTGDKRYYNSQLSKNPFSSWKNTPLH
ncbi:CYTH domain-containing protein [Aquimarina sp. W85]|uniref:CYTH domain-containing protein n=1 Tax=Aquimarina rhodophyticola TaxID=3342246 RepID=UPI003672BACD